MRAREPRWREERERQRERKGERERKKRERERRERRERERVTSYESYELRATSYDNLPALALTRPSAAVCWMEVQW